MAPQKKKTLSRVSKPKQSEILSLPSALKAIWNSRSDLQEVFPNPEDLKRGYGQNENFLGWAARWGRIEHSEIDEFYSENPEEFEKHKKFWLGGW